MDIQFLHGGGQILRHDQVFPSWMLGDRAFCNHGLQVRHRLRSITGKNLQSSLQNQSFPLAKKTYQRLAM